MKPAKHEMLYGMHPVMEAFRAGKRTVWELWLQEGPPNPRLQAIEQLAAAAGIRVSRLKKQALSERAGSPHHQGVVARASACPVLPFDALLSHVAEAADPPLILLLDSIQDPHNFGALVRTALGAGVQAVVVPKDRSVSPTPSVSKASAGALEHMPLVQITNLSDTLSHLKDAGLWIAGLALEGASDLYHTDLKGPLGLVVGSEGTGLRPRVRKSCDFLVRIPQAGPVSSLNASVAGAVVLYETVRQRRAARE